MALLRIQGKTYRQNRISKKTFKRSVRKAIASRPSGWEREALKSLLKGKTTPILTPWVNDSFFAKPFVADPFRQSLADYVQGTFTRGIWMPCQIAK